MVLFQSLAGEGSQRGRVVPEPSRPCFLIVQRLDDLGCDCVLLFSREGFDSAQSFLEQTRHIPMVARSGPINACTSMAG